MPRMIFPNLPVKDLAKTKAFWTAMGFSFNPQFTDDNAACLVVNDLACVMLLREEFWATFTKKPLPDRINTTGVFMAYSCDDKAAVTKAVETALANGGSPASPSQDHGFMFGWSFYDCDGHHWEPFWMDPANVQPN